MSDCRLSVLVADDERRVRSHVVGKLCRLCPECVVVGEAADGFEALRIIEEKRPDLVLTDIRMPGMDGLSLAKSINAKYAGTAVVILSGYSEFEYARQSLRLGVFDYLLKPVTDDKLKEAIEGVLAPKRDRVQNRRRGMLFPSSIEGVDISRLAAKEYCVFLLCAKNLKPDGFEEEPEEASPFAHVDWSAILEGTLEEWVLADEWSGGQKCLLVPAISGTDAQSLANKVHERLRGLGGPLSNIAVCYSSFPFRKDELWAGIQNLKRTLRDCRMMCEPTLVDAVKFLAPIENEESALKYQLECVVRQAARETDFTALHRDLSQLLSTARKGGFTQKLYEKLLWRALDILEISRDDHGANPAELRKSLARGITEAMEIEDVDSLFFSCCKAMMSTQPSLDKNAVWESVIQYVDSNCHIIESVETVAAAFGYNPSYLSRAFKQRTGKSIKGYIIGKRMERAKNMMDLNPELNIREVAEAMGYPEQQYFSRLFKNVCGISPSDYRAHATK
ncbi:MAG: response regulator [Clostridiales bacterium]|jgi:YesN/AraC family two-component response regulator|nr:response regulator [Clostridiales bacterium]